MLPTSLVSKLPGYENVSPLESLAHVIVLVSRHTSCVLSMELVWVIFMYFLYVFSGCATLGSLRLLQRVMTVPHRRGSVGHLHLCVPGASGMYAPCSSPVVMGMSLIMPTFMFSWCDPDISLL